MYVQYFHLGTLQAIPKKEIIRRKFTRDIQAPVKKPENVITLDKEEDSVEQTVEEIFKIIKNYQKQYKKPLDFFTLVLHPNDFGKTIENILHVSFLVRDGLVKICYGKSRQVDEQFSITYIHNNVMKSWKLDFSDDGMIPHIMKTSKDEINDVKKQKKNFQNVFSFNMKQWKVSIKKIFFFLRIFRE